MATNDRIRDKKIQVWVTEEEYNYAKDKAEYSGLNISSLVRSYILKGTVIKYETVPIKELCFEINKIGNNINQIAKKVNENNTVNEKDMEELKTEYQKLFDLYLEKIMGVK